MMLNLQNGPFERTFAVLHTRIQTCACAPCRFANEDENRLGMEFYSCAEGACLSLQFVVFSMKGRLSLVARCLHCQQRVVSLSVYGLWLIQLFLPAGYLTVYLPGYASQDTVAWLCVFKVDITFSRYMIKVYVGAQLSTRYEHKQSMLSHAHAGVPHHLDDLPGRDRLHWCVFVCFLICWCHTSRVHGPALLSP